jgi:Holliday junction DNA helicase RuvA
MYEYLIGQVGAVHPNGVVYEVGGIGYFLNVANPYGFKPEGRVYVHLVVREDSHTLYGFANVEEKALFLKLTSVTGIGPKSALAILAAGDVDSLVGAIESDNVSYLLKFPGVGKKTASQIILDLKGKLADFEVSDSVVHSNELEDALEALIALGYSAREVKKLKLLPGSSASEYMQQGLKLLNK